jgi:hypothetical protein
MRLSALLPLLPFAVLGLTYYVISAAYTATFESGVLGNTDMVTPPISLLMFAGRGKIIGQLGFPAIALGFYCCALPFFHGLTSCPSLGVPDATFLFVTSCVAFASLAAVGIVPLQPDIALVMQGQARLGLVSLAHQSAAGSFFLFTILHMIAWLHLTATVPPGSPLHWRRGRCSALFKAACLLLALFPLPSAFLLHPASPLRSHLSLSEADKGGITQYSLVALVSAFFASYAVEMRLIDVLVRRDQDAKTAKSS